MIQVAKQYNYCMDFLKGIACIFVVFIHVKFPGDVGQAIQAIARFAVPFFFMVSGYYCFRRDYLGVTGGGKKIFHIVRITFFAYLFYIIVALLDNILLGGSNQFDFSKSHILHVAIYSVPYNVPAQLWFLIALMEVYVLYLIVDFLQARTIAYVIAALAFLAMVLLAQGAWMMGHSLSADYYRNAWIEGFSFFTLGYFLHDKQDKLNIGNKTLLIIIFFSVISSIVERFVCGRIFAVHLSTYFLVTSLFIYAINNSDKHAGVIQRIGKENSMFVYILHLFFWRYCDKLFHVLGWEDEMAVLWIRPLIVLSLTILASMGCYTLFNHKKETKQELYYKK